MSGNRFEYVMLGFARRPISQFDLDCLEITSKCVTELSN